MLKHYFVVAIVLAAVDVGSARGGQAGRGATPRPSAPKTSAPTAQTPAVAPGLTNEDVMKMVQAGLGEAVVMATVRTAKSTAFDLSPDALIALKKGGVSDAIVAVMIDPKAVSSVSGPPSAPVISLPGAGPAADSRARIDSPTASPEIPREPGIYWDKGIDGGHNLVALEPTVFSQGKSGGFFTSAMTYGIKKINWKAVARGSAAGLHISSPEPTFYFYFEGKGSGLGGAGGFAGWLASATSPNEFVLARMTSTSRDRELVVGEIGAFGGNSGTRSKDTVDLQIDKLSGGIYRVRPTRALEPGEYCFFYASGVGSMGVGGASTAGKLFDFGIYAAASR